MKLGGKLKFEFILSATNKPEKISEFFGTSWILEILNKKVVESLSLKIYKNRLDKSC